MAWITCATCGAKRGGINAAIYREPDGQLTYAQPGCWNCDAPGWDMPADQDPEQTQPLGTSSTGKADR